jgi:membrane fusion protein, multidrug efflux system
MKQGRGKRVWQAVAAIVLVVAVAGAYAWYRESLDSRDTNNAYVNADIGQVSGQVEHVDVRDNQRVHKGDLLFDIDRRPFEVALGKADAKLALARQTARQDNAGVGAGQAKLRRAEAAQGGVTASPDVLQAQAEIAQATLDLGHTRIIAPADGWVTHFSLVAGSNVMANAPIAALIVDDSFWFDANFKETQLAGLHPGQAADIVVDI